MPWICCFHFQFDCSNGCRSCVKGQCMESYSYWQYDLQNNCCVSFCYDSIIVGFQECDELMQKKENVQILIIIVSQNVYECQSSLCKRCMPPRLEVVQFECAPQQCDVGDCQFESAPESLLRQKVCGVGIIQDLGECDDANTIQFHLMDV